MVMAEDNKLNKQTSVKVNSARAWLLAARPKTLSGAAVPVMIGIAWAYHVAHNVLVVPALLCCLFAFIMQIDANLVNDYFDFKHGNDDVSTRLGPKRACAEGWITPQCMLRGIAVTTALACIAGLPLIVYGGWSMVIVGLCCVLFCFLYTLKFSYLGLGDVLVLVFFGIVPVTLTFYLSVPGHQLPTLDVWLSSIATGLVIDTLLIVNNYRDRDNDRRDGKITLVVRIGEKAAELLYLFLGLIGLAIPVVILAVHTDDTTFWLYETVFVFYLILHISTWNHMVRINHGKELNRILGKTARNMFLYGVTNVVILLI